MQSNLSPKRTCTFRIDFAKHGLGERKECEGGGGGGKNKEKFGLESNGARL